MMKNYALSALLIISFFTTFGQVDVTLRINHLLDGQQFQLNQESSNDFSEAYRISRMSYYISRFTVIHDGGQEANVPDAVLELIKVNNSTPFTDIALGSLNVSNIEGIKFHIGVYNPINLADPGLQTSGTALAPQNPSMHWGWAFGYRFLALEGTCGTNFSQSFQLHGLGENNYFERTVMMQGATIAGGLMIDIDANYEKSMANISLEDAPVAHGTNQGDLVALYNFRDEVFSPRQLASLNSHEANSNTFNVYPNPSTTGQFTLDFNSNNKDGEFIITDSQGRVVQVLSNESQQFKLNGKGMYFISRFENNSLLSHQKIICN